MPACLRPIPMWCRRLLWRRVSLPLLSMRSWRMRRRRCVVGCRLGLLWVGRGRPGGCDGQCAVLRLPAMSAKLATVVGSVAAQLPRLAARRGHVRAVEHRTAVHAGGVGRAGRIYCGVPARFVVRIAAVAARPGTIRAHPPGRRGSFSSCAAVVAAGNRCCAGSGSSGFPAPRSALLAYGTGRTVRRVRESHF